MRILLVDNYDSFVYNIYHLIKEICSCDLIVVRNDQMGPEEVGVVDPDAIIISPGPGDPRKREDTGYSVDIVKTFYTSKPILGICMGHQIIGLAMGAGIRKAREIRHGKVSLIRHLGGALYKGVPQIFRGMRYHSYVVDKIPEDLRVDAVSVDDGEIMGVSHRSYPVFGVQFHPESVGTESGLEIFRSFLSLVRT